MAPALDLIMNQPQLLQDWQAQTWSGRSSGISGATIRNNLLASPISDGNDSPRTSSRSSSDVSFPDSSPELEIMEVRRIAKPSGHHAKGISRSPTKSPLSSNFSSRASTPSLSTIPKRESFDLSVVDPVLRSASAPCTTPSIPTIPGPSIGEKRPGEDTEEGNNKRIKENPSGLLTPPGQASSSGPDAMDIDKPGPTSAPMPIRPPPPQWQPNTWSKQDYIHFCKAIETSFNFAAYGAYVRRHPAEIQQVFRGIVLSPIAEVIDARFPTQVKNPSEEAMTKYKANETKLSAILADEDAVKIKALKVRALAEIGAELRIQIEDEIRTQLKNEGWVQLNKAKDLIAGYEKEINETKPEIGSDGDGRKKAKTKTLVEAQKDLLAASVAFEKARKAEDRKIRAAEREAKGENGKKLGRPKKGDGKGKGADFV